MPNMDKPVKLDEQVKSIQKQYEIVGRFEEIKKILIAYYAGKNILIEGEVGTSKTTLARAFADYMDKKFFRVDGSEDVLSHVLVGYFDPPLVIAKGYTEDAFLYGPLSRSMMNGGVLFVNELNRLPESTQNVLLSALDEGYLDVPKLPPIKKKTGFITIATMNPAEHVGVSNLGSALRDRFVWINVEFQSEEEETEIIRFKINNLIKDQQITLNEPSIDKITKISARIIKLTRNHKNLRRGASVRAGIDIASLVLISSSKDVNIQTDPEFWYSAAHMSLSTKIELEDGADTNLHAIINEIVDAALKDF
jgi:MoxR-like ATPase